MKLLSGLISMLVLTGSLWSADYAIVVSAKTQAAPDWQKVVAALQEKHAGASILTWEKSPAETLEKLQQTFPRYVCFVAQPSEAGEEMVRSVHAMMTAWDTDPYTDAFWGILTGYDAANALEIAQETKPLVVRKVASGTEVVLDRCEEGRWFCELRQGHSVVKEKGGQPVAQPAPKDTTAALADTLTKFQADLFVTSGHATERDWQIGFRYKNGYWHSKAGELFGIDTKGNRVDIKSTNPKVYMPIGNCLMGHIDGPDAMALAFMKSAGVRQMFGYIVPTWYGYQGWGCLDYFVEQPGRYSLNEAFFANHHALVHKLSGEKNAMDVKGLTFDRDVVAFYGDPAWDARMAAGTCSFQQELRKNPDGSSTLKIAPLLGKESFATVNKNGSQRGGRPIIQFLEKRINPASVKITAGEDLQPQFTDNFVLIPLPKTCDPERTYEVTFQAQPLVK
jgi:hypothetical protein